MKLASENWEYVKEKVVPLIQSLSNESKLIAEATKGKTRTWRVNDGLSGETL